VILFREVPLAVSTKRPLVSTGDVRLVCGRIRGVVGCPVSWQTAILLTGVAKVLIAFSQSALLSEPIGVATLGRRGLSFVALPA
jgi:hypothetical protein